MIKVRVVQSDDWEGIYVNGKLVAQGHSLSKDDWLEALKDGWDYCDEFEVSGDWLENEGWLPDTWEEYAQKEFGNESV